MRPRLLVSLIVVVFVALAAAGLRTGVGAQDATTQGHPLVGTWLADTDQENPDNAVDVFQFTSDGAYVEMDANGDSSLGAWEATGDTTATLTVVQGQADDEGTNFGTFTLRASIEVGADGDSFTAEYTFEFVQPDGTSSGEAGPGIATGERLVVEGPGTPAMTMEEFYGSFGDDGGDSDEATPVP